MTLEARANKALLDKLTYERETRPEAYDHCYTCGRGIRGREIVRLRGAGMPFCKPCARVKP